MKRQLLTKKSLILAVVLGLSMGAAQSAPVTAIDLDTLTIGPKVIGPIGPEVESTFINSNNEGLADFVGSASCPAGFTSCVPPENPPGTIYTFIYDVTPGVDTFNDSLFPLPDPILPLDGTTEFRLNFPASGFTGVAGFSFASAQAVLDDISVISIELLGDGSLAWNIPENAGWDSGETIRFFWQTPQRPVSPDGQFGIANSEQSGIAAGPLPAPVVAVVAEPGTLALFLIVGFVLISLNLQNSSLRSNLASRHIRY
jgi:hypothetical protein